MHLIKSMGSVTWSQNTATKDLSAIWLKDLQRVRQFKSSDKFFGIVKIADFGFSRVMFSDYVQSGKCGTPETMAPEIYFSEDMT